MHDSGIKWMCDESQLYGKRAIMPMGSVLFCNNVCSMEITRWREVN